MDQLKLRPISALALALGTLMLLAVVVERPVAGGPQVFLGIADRVAQGMLPYRDFALEYPPLALFPIALPRLLSPTSEFGYLVLFMAMSVTFTLGVAACLAWLADRGWSATPRQEALVAFFALVLAAFPQVVWRFDILPALLTILALVLVSAGLPAWAGFALGLGTAAKMYPALLLPVLLLYYAFGRRWHSATACAFGYAALIGSMAVMLYLFAGEDGFAFLIYQEERGVEIESVLGGLILLSHNLFGTDAVIYLGFGSFQVESSLTPALAAPNLLFLLVLGTTLLVGIVISFRRDYVALGRVRAPTLVSYLTATLLLTMLANKVLSPQYVAWLLPFGALLPWRQTLLLVVICALTTVIYPLRFDDLRATELPALLALNVRNALLPVLFLWLAIPRRLTDEARREPEPGSEGQMDAMLDRPPTRPAPIPKASKPMARRRRRGAISTISRAANVTVATFARVRPGRPASLAR